ncbi:glycosyltransferase family 4 protein [Pontibacter sp. SGAir0037]|uniref:glycosyltransferase family 4 protein n=1 Tax=Pontibacter sp. SGAir0037 TaxID=2571030 RepID=UPI0010CD6272|nr:glycosyltransferase family 4 protein [Pontibacter sp. SGAir0037]QCR24768.1 hypothetical protein C1N53_22035 [Pontibacter sp. SGAir0037]
MTNILVVVPVIAREGVTSLVIPQINELAKRGFSVTLAVLSRIKLENNASSLTRVKVYELKSSESYLSAKAVLTAALLAKSLGTIVKKEHISVVIAHTPYAHFLARLVKLTVKPPLTLKLVQYFHFPQFLQFPNNTMRRKLFHAFMGRLALKLDDVHISVSKQVKSDIEENLIKLKEHHVLYNTLPPDKNETIVAREQLREWWKNADSFKVLLPGRLDYNKGQLFFLEVFKEFVGAENLQADQVELLVVGEGLIQQELYDSIKQLNLDKYIVLSGALPYQDVGCLMHKADVVVVPSELEGMPMVVLEALRVKSVVLASDIGGINEVIANGVTGFLFRKRNKSDCLQKLNYIYKNRTKELVDKAKIDEEFQTRLSFEHHIQQLIALVVTKP